MALSRFVLPYADAGSGIKPSQGAKLFFFETGTSNPKNTFNGPDGEFANSNPVIANSKGVFPDIFFSGTFKVILKDKDDAQIWEADPVYSFVNSNQVGLQTEYTAATVADMILGFTASMDQETELPITHEIDQRWRTEAYNAPVVSNWIIVSSLGVDDFGVAVTGGLFAKLIVDKEVDPRAFGLYLDGTTIDDWTTVLNFVFPSTPSFNVGGADYYKARYPIKFIGRSLINATQQQNKITVSPTKILTGFSLSGPRAGLAYATRKANGGDFPMLAGFKMVDGLAADTPALLLDRSPNHYLGFFDVQGEQGVTYGIRRNLSANGRLECLDLSHHKTGMYNDASGITRASCISASFCDVGGVRNLDSGDSDWLQCYFNTNNVDYTGTDFVTGAGITFESQSSNCNYYGGKSEYNGKGCVIIDSLGINIDDVSWDANRLGSIHMYNTVVGLPQELKSINVGDANRFLSGGQEVGDGKDSQIYIQTVSDIDVQIGGSFRRGGTLAYDDNPGDATRPVGPLGAVIKVKYLGTDPTHELNLTLSGDARRGAVANYVNGIGVNVTPNLVLRGNPTRDLPNTYFQMNVDSTVTHESKSSVTIVAGPAASFAGDSNIDVASSVRTGTGEVVIRFKHDYDDANYVVTRNQEAAGYSTIAFKGTNGFTMQTRDNAGVLIDTNFNFECK